MDISIIHNKNDLQSLETEWNSLLHQSSVDSIFMTWEWISAWLDSSDETIYNNLMVIVIRDDNKNLVGIAPLYKAPYVLLGLIRLTVLRVIGDEGTGGEYPGLIIQKNRHDIILNAILTKLKENNSHWDLLWLTRMSGWDGHKEELVKACNDAGFSHKARTRSFSYFGLPDSYPDFESSLSSNRRQQFRRQAKKINANSDITITTCKNKDELPDYLHSLFELHAARREILGDVGTFKRKPQQIEFYKIFTESALNNNWLWFYALKDSGVIKAIQVGYVRNNVFYQIQEGFEPNYLPGAGNMLRLEVIKNCIEKGVTEFDFLGEHTEHKRRWTSVERMGWDILFGKSSLLSRLILVKPFWPTGRYLRPAK